MADKTKRTYDDFYWLNETSRLFLSRGYLLEGQTAEDRLREIAEHAEGILGKAGFADKFYHYLSKGYYSLSTPVWTNFGNKRGLSISCFGSHVADTIPGILHTASEVGMMSKYGGGTSGYFGDVRPRGSAITNNGKSSGAVHFMKLFEQMTDTISQGNARRGRFAPYLPIDHPDILEFLDIGSEGNDIQDVNHAVTVTDKWMLEMLSGDKDKRQVWAKVIQRRVEMGYPYIFFTDTVNNNKPTWYKDQPITHSNLCVTGDTELLTDKGYIKARDLYESGEELIVQLDNRTKAFNGEDKGVSLDNSTPMQLTARGADVYEIKTKQGFSIKATGWHKFYVKESDGSITKKPLSELNLGDRLLVQSGENQSFGINDDEELAYIMGVITGDGTLYRTSKGQNMARVSLHQDKKYFADDIKEKVDNLISRYPIRKYRSDVNKTFEFTTKELNDNEFLEGTSVQLGDILVSFGMERETKLAVPQYIKNGTREVQTAYLSGLFQMDGCVNANKPAKAMTVELVTVSEELAKGIQKLILGLGVYSTIYKRAARIAALPDGQGGNKDYDCSATYRVSIQDRYAREKFVEQVDLKGKDKEKFEDFNKILSPKSRKPKHDYTTDIVSIEHVGQEDVYDVTQESYHSIIFNGFVTGNCSEIALPDNDKWSFVCNLSSMNVLHYDEWKGTDAVETMVYFLDAVMSEFINDLELLRDSDNPEDTMSFVFMERAYNFAVANRALGIGVLGLHSLYQSKLIPFASVEASLLNEEIFKTIKQRAETASEQLAIEYGEPELLKGTGRRNATLMAVAPTTSSAFIIGQVSQSIEPAFSNTYVKDVAKAKVTIVNQYLKEVLEAYGKDDRETWASIRMYDGSVQHLDFLSDNEKEVFKTFAEINQYEIINQASIRQKYIDQGQSLNIMINPGTTTGKEMNELYIYAWENGIKTMYYQHSTNAAQQFYRSSICLACEA